MLILNIVSIIGGVIGVVLSAYTLNNKLNAERDLFIVLHARMKESKEFTSIVIELKEQLENASLSERELKELQLAIEKIAYELPRNEREDIFDSLHQKSAKGRVNYLKRLIDNSNVSEQAVSI